MNKTKKYRGERETMFQSLHFMCSAAKRRRGASRSGRAERGAAEMNQKETRNQKHNSNSWLCFLLRSPSKDSILSASLWTVMDGL